VPGRTEARRNWEAQDGRSEPVLARTLGRFTGTAPLLSKRRQISVLARFVGPLKFPLRLREQFLLFCTNFKISSVKITIHLPFYAKPVQKRYDVFQSSKSSFPRVTVGRASSADPGQEGCCGQGLRCGICSGHLRCVPAVRRCSLFCCRHAAQASILCTRTESGPCVCSAGARCARRRARCPPRPPAMRVKRSCVVLPCSR
jgi:hypothetical protein